MSLTNTQLNDLAKRMGFKLEAVVFKSELKDMKLKHNVPYICNLENEFTDDGERNDGSHYTCFQSNKNINGKVENIYLDSYGVAPPEEVLDFLKVKHVPYNTKDLQSLQQHTCGWYCVAFLYFINAYHNRTKSLYDDADHFIQLFKDLNTSSDHKYNEYVLKLFFQSSCPKIRAANPVTVFAPGDFRSVPDHK